MYDCELPNITIALNGDDIRLVKVTTKPQFNERCKL